MCSGNIKLFLLFFILILIGDFFGQSCPNISTFFGTSQVDEFKGVCNDHKGNIYAFGNTYNNDLPVTAGAFQSTLNADYESFLVKMDSCGNLIWCTYFGTNGFDFGEKIVYSPYDSSIVFTGYTDGNDLATTASCFQPTNNGNYDAFLAKFDLAGQPKWITYFGDAQGDFSFDVTIDNHANILIGGTTLSPTLYTTSQSFQSTLGGAVDSYIAKFDKNGSFKFSTFYGGTNAEDIHKIKCDNDRNIIAVGGSFSNNLNTSASCFQPSSNGGMEIYLIKFDSIGNRIFSTYIGGSALDDCYGLEVDSQQNIYLFGHTESNDFYYTAVSQQTVVNGMADNYAMKLSSVGAMQWSNIYGGVGQDLAVSSAMDENENLFFLSNSQSSDFPMTGVANNTVHAGSNDMVISKLNTNGNILFSTYHGGSGDDQGTGLTLLNNKVIVSGFTGSANFPVVTGNFQTVIGGQSDGFISTIVTPVAINLGQKKLNNLGNLCEAYFTNNRITHHCTEKGMIEIYDLNGKLVYSADLSDAVILEQLNIGQIYYILVKDNQNQIVAKAKFIK
ncbi:MAG: SBBP repeat-containing protein [Bacteroidia bacterium]